MSRTHAQASAPHRLAAIDLGSNSFHLLVADYCEGRLRDVAKLSEKVQLAAGLDNRNILDEPAMKRALDCLARFAPYLDGDAAPRQLRVVGTNALRIAVNSQEFITHAEALLGHDIEVISGREEARLIYLGAAHALDEIDGRRLVVDIGGGSTEFIIGEGLEPRIMESLQVGCVAYTRRFFGDGLISEARFHQAELAALSEIAHIRRAYLELGWVDPVGSSGSIKAIASVLAASGKHPAGVIRRHDLNALQKRLSELERLDNVSLEGLKTDRSRIFPAGVAILKAIFEAFGLESMRYADGALREGVLHDLQREKNYQHIPGDRREPTWRPER